MFRWGCGGAGLVLCDLGLQPHGWACHRAATGPSGANLNRCPPCGWLSPGLGAGWRVEPGPGSAHGLPVGVVGKSSPHTTTLSFRLTLNFSRPQLSLLNNKSIRNPIRINQELVENKISGPSSDPRGQRPHVTRNGQLSISKWNMGLDSEGSEWLKGTLWWILSNEETALFKRILLA